MPIPTYTDIMLPFLSLLDNGGEFHIRAVELALASSFNLSDQELAERIPSGQSTIFANRVGWARTYLKKSGLIEPVARGTYRITERGSSLLKSKPIRIDTSLLRQFPEFLEFQRGQVDEGGEIIAEAEVESTQTPLEILDDSYQRIRGDLADELLQTIREASPAFFERLVVDLLVKMGYGGTLKDAGKAVGRTGDDGIDGIIKEDRLGLDAVYIQAKRWETLSGVRTSKRL